VPELTDIVAFLKLVAFMIFVSSIGAQGWIAFLDITSYFSKNLERFRPEPIHDKLSRIAVIIGVFVLAMG
jgi:hypothetical protein